MSRGVAAHMAVHGEASERQRHHAHMLAVQTQLRALHATVSDTIPLQRHRTPVQRTVLHRTSLVCDFITHRHGHTLDTLATVNKHWQLHFADDGHYPEVEPVAGAVAIHITGPGRVPHDANPAVAAVVRALDDNSDAAHTAVLVVPLPVLACSHDGTDPSIEHGREGGREDRKEGMDGFTRQRLTTNDEVALHKLQCGVSPSHRLQHTCTHKKSHRHTATHRQEVRGDAMVPCSRPIVRQQGTTTARPTRCTRGTARCFGRSPRRRRRRQW
jgi:hypothetical protein